MLDITNINPMGLLATGGIVAAVVAGWAQVKQAFSYIASFVITEDTLYSRRLAREVFTILREDYNLLPSTQRTYTTKFMEVGRKNNYVELPFKWHSGISIFYKWNEIFIVRVQSYRLSLHGIRGLTNVQKLVVRAAQAVIDEAATNRGNDFRVIDIMGSEKIGNESYKSLTRGNSSSPGGIAVEEDEAPEGISNIYNPKLDKPLLHSDNLQAQETLSDHFEGLFYEAAVWKVVDDIKAWYQMRPWYMERGISWRRGICLHGPGGTGKSALITAVSKHLGVRLYRFYLSTMSDQEFVEEWKSMITPCVVAFEDFDTVFNGRTPLTEHKALTFDCILNEISGVKTKDGVLLVVTTNHLDHIDPAMGIVSEHGDISTRPGRIDVTCYLGNISEENKVYMANRILRGHPELIAAALEHTAPMTPIQFQELCTQKAYSLLTSILKKES